MTGTTPATEKKPFLGAPIDAEFRDMLIEDAKKAAFFIRLMAKPAYALGALTT